MTEKKLSPRNGWTRFDDEKPQSGSTVLVCHPTHDKAWNYYVCRFNGRGYTDTSSGQGIIECGSWWKEITGPKVKKWEDPYVDWEWFGISTKERNKHFNKEL